ncbi:hypothetical protein B0H17DRAFT_903185, partial [Mycena rosella]
DGRRRCHVCNKDVAGPDRQNHMGKHIMLSMRQVAKKNITSPLATEYSCGFCGNSMENGSCNIEIKHGKAVSSCPDTYQFLVSAASKASGSHPCTNMPMRCPLACNTIQWKYNMERHLADRHPDWQETTSRDIKDKLSADLSISHEEECRLGVPD